MLATYKMPCNADSTEMQQRNMAIKNTATAAGETITSLHPLANEFCFLYYTAFSQYYQ